MHKNPSQNVLAVPGSTRFNGKALVSVSRHGREFRCYLIPLPRLHIVLEAFVPLNPLRGVRPQIQSFHHSKGETEEVVDLLLLKSVVVKLKPL